MVISDFFHLRLGASVGVIVAFPTGPSVCWGGGGGGGAVNRLPV